MPDRHRSPGGNAPLGPTLSSSTPEVRYREPALAELAHGNGSPLWFAPPWRSRSLALIGLASVTIVTVTPFLTVSTVVSGQAVLRIRGEVRVVAPVSAVIESVEIATGAAVRRGQPLIRLANAADRIEVQRLESEYRSTLARRLHDPAAPETGAALAESRAVLMAARSRLEERTIRSPFDGFVSALRIRSGESVAAGQPVFDLALQGERLEALIAIPAAMAARLRSGSEATLGVDGFSGSRIPIVLRTVDPTILGIDEAKQVMGADGVVPIIGPVTIARAELPSAWLIEGSQHIPLRPGMSGRAFISAKRRQVAQVLVEWLGVRTPHG